jgi:DNA-binding response OmpR family regulator
MVPSAFVLVVDDDPSVGSEIEQALRRPDVAIHVAATSAAAVDLLSENRYAVIILDIVLSGGSGFDVLAHARDHEIDVPVIVVSAFIPEYVHELLAQFGMVRIVHPKPYDAKALAALVAVWLDGG